MDVYLVLLGSPLQGYMHGSPGAERLLWAPLFSLQGMGLMGLWSHPLQGGRLHSELCFPAVDSHVSPD